SRRAASRRRGSPEASLARRRRAWQQNRACGLARAVVRAEGPFEGRCEAAAAVLIPALEAVAEVDLAAIDGLATLRRQTGRAILRRRAAGHGARRVRAALVHVGAGPGPGRGGATYRRAVGAVCARAAPTLE